MEPAENRERNSNLKVKAFSQVEYFKTLLLRQRI